MALGVERISCDRLVGLLQQEKALYARFLELSGQQLAVIQGGDVSELLALLGRKQELLGQIDRVEQELSPAKENWDEVRASLSADERPAVEAMVEEVRRVLEELIALERKGEGLLRQQRQHTLDQIAQTERGCQLGSAYRAGAKPVVNRYVDTTDVEDPQDAEH